MRTGSGYENLVFPENGIISSQFLDSDILNRALSQYYKDPNTESRQISFGFTDLVRDGWRNGSLYNISGLTGSGEITITPTVDGLKIKIFNITSLTSGTFGKEITSITGQQMYPVSYVRPQGEILPFGNVSQTFNLFLPNGHELLKN